VPGPRDTDLYLDLGIEELRYAVEYDGAEWHGPEQREHDRRRRRYLREVRGYLIDVLRAENIHGPHQDADLVIRRGIARARARRR
jgi:very-short-patch-repair endonuclease